MPVDVLTEVVISRPRDVVAAYAGDPTNAIGWYANIRSVEWRTSPPLDVGSQLDFVAHFLGRRLAYTYEIVELTPGERLVMRTAQGPFPMETTYEWEPIGDGATRMRLRNRGNPAGVLICRAVMRLASVGQQPLSASESGLGGGPPPTARRRPCGAWSSSALS